MWKKWDKEIDRKQKIQKKIKSKQEMKWDKNNKDDNVNNLT